MNILLRVVLAIYLLINGLFIYKYGQRQNFINWQALLSVYIVVVSLIIYMYKKGLFNLIKDNRLTRFTYWLLILVCSVLFSFVIFKTDGNSLHVDRWSALDLTIEGLLYGQYPYSQVNHVGNMSSNFPGLGYLALPFYLLGDVGYLQVFVFILFTFYLYKKSTNLSNSFFILFLFLLSPAILWEISVKSDLVSNLMLFVLFLEFWNYKKTLKKPLLLGGIIAFFLMTRAIVVVPIIIFFFRDFYKSMFDFKVKLVVSIIITSLLLCLPILLSAPNLETIIAYNPIVLQTNKTPKLAYAMILFAFYIPFFIKKRNDYYFYSAIIIFVIPLISMIISIINVGWHTVIYEHTFDVSYLSMCLPFLFVWGMSYIDEISVKD